MELDIKSEPTDEGGYLVAVAGEIDISNAAELRQVLYTLAEQGVSDIIIDLTEVPFIDSTGIGVLMGATRRAKEAGGRVGVICPHENLLRVFELLGLDQQFEMLDVG